MILSKKLLSVIIIVIGIGILGYFLIIDRNKSSDDSESAPLSSSNPVSSGQKPEETPLPVKVAPAVRQDLLIRLKTPGEAVSEKNIVLKAEVSGVIKTLGVHEGKKVRENDVLAGFDDDEYKLRLQRHEAMRLKYLSELLLEDRFAGREEAPSAALRESIEKSRGEFERANALYEKGLISRVEYERLKKEYERRMIETGSKKEQVRAAAKGLTQAEIDVELARIDLEKTKIKAPFPGVVTAIKVSPGENVSAGRELFTLVNTDRIKVLAAVLESEIGKIKTGRDVNVRFSSYPDKVFKGTIEAISPLVNPADRTCKVHILMANPAGEIKPGMHAEVEIVSEIYRNRLLIPQEAVLVRGGRKLAFVVEGGLAKWRYFDVGVENESFAEVLNGIQEGENVIVEGHFTLAHDARVAVVNKTS